MNASNSNFVPTVVRNTNKIPMYDNRKQTAKKSMHDGRSTNLFQDISQNSQLNDIKPLKW